MTSALSFSLPILTLDNESILFTLEAKYIPFVEHIKLSPINIIRQMPGNRFEDNGDFISSSQYYTPSEFIEAKYPEKSFSILHINITSLSLHFDELKMLLSLLGHYFDVVGIYETKIKDTKEPQRNISLE